MHSFSYFIFPVTDSLKKVCKNSTIFHLVMKLETENSSGNLKTDGKRKISRVFTNVLLFIGWMFYQRINWHSTKFPFIKYHQTKFPLKGLEETSHLHRINTSTTYISTRRKQQISGKPLHKTEVCYQFVIHFIWITFMLH